MRKRRVIGQRDFPNFICESWTMPNRFSTLLDRLPLRLSTLRSQVTWSLEAKK